MKTFKDENGDEWVVSQRNLNLCPSSYLIIRKEPEMCELEKFLSKTYWTEDEKQTFINGFRKAIELVYGYNRNFIYTREIILKRLEEYAGIK